MNAASSPGLGHLLYTPIFPTSALAPRDIGIGKWTKGWEPAVGALPYTGTPGSTSLGARTPQERRNHPALRSLVRRERYVTVRKTLAQ